MKRRCVVPKATHRSLFSPPTRGRKGSTMEPLPSREQSVLNSRVGGGALGITLALASARRTNGSGGFPASRFYTNIRLEGSLEGIRSLSLASFSSSYSFASGSLRHAVLRHRLDRCARMRQTIHLSSCRNNLRA